MQPAAIPAAVMVRRLLQPHQSESFTRFQPLNGALKQEVFAAVAEIFNAAGGKSLLKPSGDVYIKPNGIDSKPYCHTRPELVEAVIRYWKENGARRIFLFENSTQGNFTRMVFAITGYSAICNKYGVKEVYLDEEKSVAFAFRGKAGEEREADGYRHTSFDMPLFVVRHLIERAGENLYINLPKLKTHSMAGVTLGVKNQWAFPQQNDRRHDHNYNLPHKLADVLGYVQPDFTLTEGIEATIHGHYPVTAFADACVLPFRVLLGSANVVAADLVGARLFGLAAEDTPHLKIAMERGYAKGVRGLEDIEILGDISGFAQRYPYDLIQRFPKDVTLVTGTRRWCPQGCKNNPLTLLQVLAYDYRGKGGWTMVMGKGHDPAAIDGIRGRVLVVGKCAVEEVGERLAQRLGRKNVYFSGHCNDLCATTNAMCHLMGVDPRLLAPYPLPASAKLLAQAKIHGTKANVPNLLAHKIKVV
ncbi:MAG: DUF362 domain-containing protein [Oscillospiraceae bacterium]|nr:DUF362 domain-containing protein [Oscillospiraceae bacterium]